MKPRLFVVAAWCHFLAAAGAAHGETIVARLDERAPGGSTWADVLALAVGPLDAREDGWIANDLAAQPNLDTGEDGQPPPETARFTDLVVKSLPGTANRFAFVADSREFFAILAIVDLSAAPRIVAAASLAHDRSITLDDVLDLGDGAAAARIGATHVNAGQGYRIDVLALLRDDRLSLVDTVLTLSDLGCGYERRQDAAYAVRPAGAGPADIEATITDTVTTTGESCDDGAMVPPPSTRSVAATYRWREAEGRYVADSDAIERLEAETRERF